MQTGELLTGHELLAPGVLGYSVDTPEGLYIPFIMAARPGAGDVGRFLDSLPLDRRVVVPCVISPLLASMLERRGFVVSVEWVEDLQEWCDIHERNPPTSTSCSDGTRGAHGLRDRNP